jgi:DNA-binding transcriptional LysR family regulator
MISSDQAEALVAGHLDAGLARSRPQHPRLASRPICRTLLPRAAAPEAGPRTGTIDLRSMAEHDFVPSPGIGGPAYFDQSIHLCAKAGFSPRIRYEASTVHGVLDLVGAGLGVALVPASCALLGVTGAKFRGLTGTRRGEVLALLQRKSDPNPVLPRVADAASAVFAALRGRVAAALAR